MFAVVTGLGVLTPWQGGAGWALIPAQTSLGFPEGDQKGSKEETQQGGGELKGKIPSCHPRAAEQVQHWAWHHIKPCPEL